MWRDFDEWRPRWEPEPDDPEYVVQLVSKTYVGPIPKLGDLKHMLVLENYQDEKRFLARNGDDTFYETTDSRLADCFDSYIAASAAITSYRDQYGEYARRNVRIIIL